MTSDLISGPISMSTGEREESRRNAPDRTVPTVSICTIVRLNAMAVGLGGTSDA
jgi:hypothetical protein